MIFCSSPVRYTQSSFKAKRYWPVTSLCVSQSQWPIYMQATVTNYNTLQFVRKCRIGVVVYCSCNRGHDIIWYRIVSQNMFNFCSITFETLVACAALESQLEERFIFISKPISSVTRFFTSVTLFLKDNSFC